MTQLLLRDDLKTLFTAMLPVHGLTATDITALTNGFKAKTAWSVEQHLDYAEELSLVIMPGDDAAPTFIVTREQAGLVLAACQGDALWTVATEHCAVGILRYFV